MRKTTFSTLILKSDVTIVFLDPDFLIRPFGRKWAPTNSFFLSGVLKSVPVLVKIEM